MYGSSQMPNYPQNGPTRRNFELPSVYGDTNTLQNVPNGNISKIQMDDAKPHEWKLYQIILAEVVGTTILMYIGCLVCTAFSFGFALLLALQAVGHVSGGFFNPAISIAALIMEQIKPIMFPVYVLSQFVGGFIGYSLHYINHTALSGFVICTTDFMVVGVVRAIIIETLITAFLAMSVCSFWDKNNPNNDGTGSIKIAFILAGLVFAAGPFTGASLNTARSLPPAAIYGLWDGHWVYWLGPNLGGALGALFYRLAISDKKWSCKKSGNK